MYLHMYRLFLIYAIINTSMSGPFLTVFSRVDVVLAYQHTADIVRGSVIDCNTVTV